MCYTVYLSTDSSQDLSIYNTKLVRFDVIGENTGDPVIGLLKFQNKWYVGSKSGCSCTFRHLSSVELGFDTPVDWYREDQAELDATKELYAVISSLWLSGNKVDCVDRWEGAEPEDIKELLVPLDDVMAESFRLFENYRFEFIRNV